MTFMNIIKVVPHIINHQLMESIKLKETLMGIVVLVISINSKCMYDLTEDTEMPFHTEREPFELGPLTACKDYLEPGRLGCCGKVNDKLTLQNFKQIDGVFSAQGGGCDICAINLKRFWCHYACSARQDQFMWTAKELKPYPDPQRPGATLMAQEVWVTVHTDTACAIYNSCKRNPFVASVSAMGSPAGFLNFQGHNALDNAHQYISMNFSNNMNDSLAFSDSIHDFPYDSVQNCDYKTSQSEIHNFTFSQNCTCSTCEEACNSNDGFIYTESSVLEDFNWQLVGGSYIAVILIAVGVTVYRKCSSNKVRAD